MITEREVHVRDTLWSLHSPAMSGARPPPCADVRTFSSTAASAKRISRADRPSAGKAPDPVMVATGAAGDDAARLAYNGTFGGTRLSAYHFTGS